MLSTLALALLAAQVPPAGDAAAPAPAAPPTAPAVAAPVGGDLFPAPPPPPGSCLANAPALGSTTMPAGVIDGSGYRNGRALARLRGTTKGVMFVRGVDFSGQRLSRRKLYDICFIGAKMGLSDWSGFKGTGLGFIDSDLTGAKFVNAKLPWSLLRDSTLAQLDATGADLSRSRLDGGWKGSMRGLKLDGAVLTGFRAECGLTSVDGCPLDRQGLSLKGADLTKASFWPFYFPDVDASGTVLDQTEVGLEHLGRFKGAKVTGPLIVRSRRTAAIFLPAELARMQRAFLSGAAAGGASFNCQEAATPVQRAICTAPSSELRRLDRAVAQLEAAAVPAPVSGTVPTRRGTVRAARQANADAEAARVAWIAERDACGTKEEDEIAPCLLTAYRARRDALARAAGAPGWIQPGSVALFISSDAPLTPEFIRSELFMRISPVVLESAQARVLVRVDEAGRMEAKGAALGECRLRAGGLLYDPATLTLGAGGTPAVMTPPTTRRRRGRRVYAPAVVAQPAVAATPVLQAAGDELRVIATGAPFAQCGPNGSFVPMTRVDLPQAALANLWAES